MSIGHGFRNADRYACWAVMTSKTSTGGSGSGGSIVVEYKPQYNITGAMNAADLQSVLEEHDSNVRGQIEDILRDIDTDRYRREYA